MIPGDLHLRRFVSLNYWVDVKTGFDYLVEVLVPPEQMTQAADVETLPLGQVNSLVNLMIHDVAKVRTSASSPASSIAQCPGCRYLTLTANVEGEDMGRASKQVAQAIEAAGTPPRGLGVIPMGQLPPMVEMFEALGVGDGVAVFVIFILWTGHLQSPRPRPGLDRHGAWCVYRDRDDPST